MKEIYDENFEQSLKIIEKNIFERTKWLKLALKNCDRFLALNQPIRLSEISGYYMHDTYMACCIAAYEGEACKIQVIMGDRPAAERACKDPNPIIDGRKANVNLAILGAKPRGNLQARIDSSIAGVLVFCRLSGFALTFSLIFSY
ncbi:hypothetical protein E2986_12813 [Frieseomelitta varia]|uniref:Uncharacterized protein n=1 Tax=Frieseomelitta varia TaxID=561572 RepID=A0A833RJZ9_9HYME|nr:hypothetical protein E2986_12813 [Frieseomelitta varia]